MYFFKFQGILLGFQLLLIEIYADVPLKYFFKYSPNEISAPYINRPDFFNV